MAGEASSAGRAGMRNQRAMSLRLLGLRVPRRWVWPLAGSLLLHALVLLIFVQARFNPGPSPAGVTDVDSTESLLELAPLAPTPAPVAALPEPAPTPEPEEAQDLPTPFAPAPEPSAAPEPAAALTDGSLEGATPTPAPSAVSDGAPAAAPPAPVARRRPPPQAEERPFASFSGVRGVRARRVVYVLDASGAMTTSLPLVKEELLRSIARLEPEQSFQVVVFRGLVGAGGKPTAVIETMTGGSGELVPASAEARRNAAAWLEKVQPAGRSNPLAGLRAALAMQPDIAFLLTRSIQRSGSDTAWGAGLEATLAALDELNPADEKTGRRRTSIKAIQFLDEDPTGMLPAIGEAHGEYRVIPLRELRRVDE